MRRCRDCEQLKQKLAKKDIEIETLVSEFNDRNQIAENNIATLKAENAELQERNDWFTNIARCKNIGTDEVPDLKTYVEKLEGEKLNMIEEIEKRIFCLFSSFDHRQIDRNDFIKRVKEVLAKYNGE